MPFVARFGFLLPVLVFLAPMFVFAFCCCSLLFVAFRGPLLLFLVFIALENGDDGVRCFLLLFVARSCF